MYDSPVSAWSLTLCQILLSVPSLQEQQTMFEYLVSGYDHCFSLGARQDDCWNINNSTHFLVTESRHVISRLLQATPSCRTGPSNKPLWNESLRGSRMADVDELWLWWICLRSLTSLFCVTFFLIHVIFFWTPSTLCIWYIFFPKKACLIKG